MWITRCHEWKTSIYHKFQPPIQIFSRAVVLLLRLKSWSNVEITELRIKQHFYWKFHLCFHFLSDITQAIPVAAWIFERGGRRNRWECTFQQIRLKITCIMTFMKSMIIRTYFALIFFPFILGACSFVLLSLFSHPSLDVARLGPTLLITRSEQNVLYLLGWIKQHLRNYFSFVWGLV